MKMHNPPHSGEVLKPLCPEPLGLTVTSAAGALGVSRSPAEDDPIAHGLSGDGKVTCRRARVAR